MKTNDAVLGIGTNGAFTTSESHATPRNRPGERCEVMGPEGMRLFKYQKAEEVFAIGQVAMVAAVILDADVDAAQATTTNVMKAVGDFTANDYGSSTGAKWPDGYVSINANAANGAGQTRHIKYNRGSTDYLTVDHNWDVALTTSSDYVTYSINYVSLGDTDDVSADEVACYGVAVSAISDENWSWFQVKGFNPLVRTIASGDAIVRGELITISATAGACKGENATLAVIDVQHAFGIGLYPYAEADSAGLGIAAMLDCRW